MKKFNLLLLLMLFAGNMAFAKWPVPKTPEHPSLKQFTQLLAQVGQSQARSSQLGFPDSAVISSWDNGAWTLDGNVGIRYQNNKISRLIFYALGIPAFQAVFTYNAAGKATLIETQFTLPGQPVQVTSRIIMNYDANGNQTSLLIFEENNGTLELTDGDSIQFTYSGNTVSQAIQMQYDASALTPAWENTQRFTALTFGSNGQLTGVVNTPWDPMTNSWMTSAEYRYSNVEWKLGYAGLSSLLGGLMDVSQFLFTELPFAENEYYFSPTDYIEEYKVGGVFVNEYKVTSTVSGGLVTQVMEQEWTNGAWADNYRVIFTYSGTNMTQALNESYSSSAWTPEYRESWTFDASSNLTEEKFESYMSGSWTTTYGKKHMLDYTADNRVYRWVSQDWDPSAMQYVNSEKREYYFGGFGLNTVDLKQAEIKLYPNPVHAELWIELPASEQGAFLQLYQMNGQLVWKKHISADQTAQPVQINLNGLAEGMYRVVVNSTVGQMSKSIIKY